MAQTGYTPIKLYASTTPAAEPLAVNLDNTNGAELAINITDGKLFYKDNAGVVQTIATKAAVTNVASISFGTTGLTPATSTTGAVTVAGTLAPANGGTGMANGANNTITFTGNFTLGLTLSANTAVTLPTTGTLATLAGTETLTNKTVEAGTFTNGYTEEVATANTGTSYTIDLANGSVQVLTLTGNCTFTFPTATAGRSFFLLLKQDGTGGRTVTWPSAVKWPGGTAPTITSTASRLDKYVFTADGTNWYGSVAGQNYTV